MQNFITARPFPRLLPARVWAQGASWLLRLVRGAPRAEVPGYLRRDVGLPPEPANRRSTDPPWIGPVC